MLKKMLALTLAGCLLFSACSSQKDNTSSGNSGQAPSTEGSAQFGGQDTKFTIWIPGDESEYQFYFDMFDNYKNFKEGNGETFNYTIEQQPWSDYWTKLPLEVSEGRGPDMFLAHDAYMDVLMPISKELDLDDDILNNLKIKGIYTGESGKDLFVPTVLVSYVIFANKELTGLSDTYPKTWSELESSAKEAMANNSGVIGLDFNFNIFSDLMYSDGVPYTKDGKPQFYTEQLAFVDKWQKDGVSDYFSYGNGSPEESFYQNVTAYIHGATWMEFWAPEEIKGKMMAFPVPSDNNDIVYALSEPTFGINKNVSDEKYQILNDLVKFMLTDEETNSGIVKGNSGIPNNNNINVSYEPFTAGDAVLKTFENKKAAFAVIPRNLEKIYKSNMEKVLSGESIDKVVEDAYKEAADVDASRLIQMEDNYRDSFK